MTSIVVDVFRRDTTVQTLTLQPTVQDGVIIYEDSPLVNAVKNGNKLLDLTYTVCIASSYTLEHQFCTIG